MKRYSFFIPLLILLGCSLGQAAGMTTHMYISELAVNYVTDHEFRKFLVRHQDEIWSGSMFPDSGYIKSNTYGEFAHWAPYHNAFARVLGRKCSWPLDNDECEKLFAFYLGAVSHGVSDSSWHWGGFINEVARNDFGGDWEAAHDWADKGVDMLAILEHNRGKAVPNFYFPKDEILEAFTAAGEPLDLNVVDSSLSTYVALFFGERVGSVFSYPYFKLKSPWGAAHYYDAKGGIDSSAWDVSVVWDKIFARLSKENKMSAVAKLKSGMGGWDLED